MLSRLNPRAGSQSLLKCIKQYQIPAACTSTTPVQNQSGQRDLVNFPRPQRLERTPETRFGFIPKSWFDFFYPKTGVTGPYMFLTSFGTYLFSKEIIVVSGEFTLFLAGVGAVMLIQMKFGDQISGFLEKSQEETIAEVDRAQIQMKESIAKEIALNNESKSQAEGIIQFLPEAKRENVYLQLEAAYRARMNDAYSKVKKHLDYQIEKQNVERRISQRNMVDYVIRNVQSSISPQLKSSALKQCIVDLKSLTGRA